MKFLAVSIYSKRAPEIIHFTDPENVTLAQLMEIFEGATGEPTREILIKQVST